MLFDLRGRHRRRAVRVIYIGLALLIGVGLVGFGIGGGFGGGGLLSAATSNEGSSSASYSKQIDKYRKLTKSDPQDVGAWENLTRNLLHEAGGEAYVTREGLTHKGHALFEEAAQAWSGYVAVAGKKPSLELAKQMLLIYGREGLNEPSQEVSLLETVVAAEPTSAARYSELAEYSYAAHDNRLGALATEKAVSLAPPSERKRVKTELEEVKKAVEKEAKESSSSSSSPTVTTGAEGTITTGSGKSK